MGIVPYQIPPRRNARRQASTELLSEWLALYHRDARVFHNLRLGPAPAVPRGFVPSPEIERMLKRRNRYADAVVVTPAELLVVEAKMDPSSAAIGQVLDYADLVTSSPELAPYASLQIVPVVLWPADDPIAHRRAAALGVRVEIYTPSWYEEWLREGYWRMQSTRQSRRAIARGAGTPSPDGSPA